MICLYFFFNWAENTIVLLLKWRLMLMLFQELATPKADTPDHGYIVPNVELSPLCSSKFRPGPPSEQAQVLSKLIDIILSNSAALDLRDLCICRSKLAWVLYCDILCLNYNGSVIDACTGALMAALKTCKSHMYTLFEDIWDNIQFFSCVSRDNLFYLL